MKSHAGQACPAKNVLLPTETAGAALNWRRTIGYGFGRTVAGLTALATLMVALSGCMGGDNAATDARSNVSLSPAGNGSLQTAENDTTQPSGAGGTAAPAGISLPAPMFQAGAARRLANPPLPICTGGYGIFCNRNATVIRTNSEGLKDDLYTRAVVFESKGKKLVIITTSAIGLFASYKNRNNIAADPATASPDTLARLISGAIDRPGLDDIRAAIAQKLSIPVTHILIQPDHSHYAPDAIGIWGGATDSKKFTQYLQELAKSMVDAAAEANDVLEPANLSVGSVMGDAVKCPLIPGKTGGCLLQSLYTADPNLALDQEFRLLEARRPDNSLIARMLNYSTHATVLDDDGPAAVSGDWPTWYTQMNDERSTSARRCATQGRSTAALPRCGLSMVTLGTLGRTDFNSSGAIQGIEDGGARNMAREKAARARLQYFMDVLTGKTNAVCKDGVKTPCHRPMTALTRDGIEVREVTVREKAIQPIFYTNHLSFVGLPAAVGSAFPIESEFIKSYASIERNNLPPYLTATVLGSTVSAVRLGSLFMGTAPGEQFPNSQLLLRDGQGVKGVQMHFFMGVTNDFIGYMGPLEGYEQVAAQGSTYLVGCPDQAVTNNFRDPLNALTSGVGYDAGRLFDGGSCPDHWVLTTSPTMGDHVTCAIQNMAPQVGFELGNQSPLCRAYTATDVPK